MQKLIVAVLAVCAAGSLAAQTPRPAAQARRMSIGVLATDPSGSPLEGVSVTAIGPVSREGTTGSDGTVRLTNLRAGTYRLRFESPTIVTFEREVTLRAGQSMDIDVPLTAAPPPPPEPEPPPPPPPPPPPEPSRPPGEVKTVSIPDFIDKNFIGRTDPVKESIVGTAAVAEARLLQVREPLRDRLNGEADEMIYVVAGEGVVRIEGRVQNLEAGWLVIIPRGTTYSLERLGRNPLVALSVITLE